MFLVIRCNEGSYFFVFAFILAIMACYTTVLFLLVYFFEKAFAVSAYVGAALCKNNE